MSKLEDQLIQNLLWRYKISGVNSQKLLDNQLFQSLPLDKKIAYIEKYKEDLTSPTSYNYKPLIGSTAYGAVGGVVGMGLRQFATGQKAGLPFYLIAAGVGAGLGSTMTAIDLYKDKVRDEKTRQNLLDNKYLSTLTARSMSSAPQITKPDWGNHVHVLNERILDFLHGASGEGEQVSAEDQ